MNKFDTDKERKIALLIKEANPSLRKTDDVARLLRQVFEALDEIDRLEKGKDEDAEKIAKYITTLEQRTKDAVWGRLQEFFGGDSVHGDEWTDNDLRQVIMEAKE